MNREELRASVLRHVNENKPKFTVSTIEDAICTKTRDTSEGFRLSIRDEIWYLLRQGILAPGLPTWDQSNSTLPHMRVTEFGEIVLRESAGNPYHGYEEYCRCLFAKMRAVPRLHSAGIDDIVLKYLYESLQVFQHHFWNSAAVMLGVATERCLHMLADCIGRTHPEKAGKFKLNKSTPRTEEFRNNLKSALDSLKLNAEIADSRGLFLQSLFDNIMWSRNAGGHPKDVNVDRYEVFIHLQLFQTYYVWILRVIAEISPGDPLINPNPTRLSQSSKPK
jgi:hypothetical protein